MKRARAIAFVGGVFGLGVLLAGTLLILGARWWWLAEVACHLRYPLGLGGFAACALLCVARRPRIAGVTALLALWHVAPLWWLSVPVDDVGPGGGPTLRLAHANLLFGRADPQRVLAWLDDVQPDVVGLTEVMDSGRSGVDWPALLRSEPWRARFPYRLILEHPHFGMALLSRLPLEDARERVVPHADGRIESRRPNLIEARVRVGERAVTLFLAHPHRPGARWRNAARADVYAEIARAAPAGDLVLFGDLNSTVYSPLFQDLLEAAELEDSRRGFGRQGSWRHPWIPGRWVTLDHVLFRADATCVERARGPLIGSDHLPVHAVLRLN